MNFTFLPSASVLIHSSSCIFAPVQSGSVWRVYAVRCRKSQAADGSSLNGGFPMAASTPDISRSLLKGKCTNISTKALWVLCFARSKHRLKEYPRLLCANVGGDLY